MLQDVRYAARSLLQSPAFLGVAVLTLALGIGANTAIFSVVNGVLLSSLPYPEPDRLVEVGEAGSGHGLSTLSPPNFVDFRREAAGFEAMAAYNEDSAVLSAGDAVEHVRIARVTPGFFTVLGVPPERGRGLRPEEETPGLDRVAVLGHEMWQRALGGDPRPVGRTVRLDGEAYQVVGVMPAGFEFPPGVGLWLAQSFTERDLTTQRGAHYLSAIGRLERGTSREEAEAQLRAVAARLASEYPNTNRDSSAGIQELRDSLVGQVRPALVILLGAVGLVLLLACANVANLSLARTLRRDRDLAVRAALGASRGRLVRSLLTESVLVGLIGGVAGLALAVWGTDVLTTLLEGRLPRVEAISLDTTVLGFAAGISALTGILFGLGPALRASFRTDLETRLRQGTRRQVGSAGSAGGLRGSLVIVQLVLATLLLAGAGLLMRSFLQLQAVDPGFEPDDVLVASVALPAADYQEPERVRRFFAAATERIRALPGVEAAGTAFGMPFSEYRYTISVEQLDGRPAYDEPGEERYVQVRVANPDYREALGITLRSGRWLSEEDRPGTPSAVVINEAAAQSLSPGNDPIGRSLELGTSMGGNRVGGEIVGVVADVHPYGLDAGAPPEIYVSHAQFPMDPMDFAIRAERGPETLDGALREAIRGIDPQVALYDVGPMTDLLADSLAERRAYMMLLACFAAVALLLAGVGIYGVVTYTVGRRSREYGLRMALGAGRREILRLALRGGWRIALAGVALGLLGALALTRTLEGLLYELSPLDPVSLLGSGAVLGAVALAAIYLPARRATRVDPMVVLREE